MTTREAERALKQIDNEARILVALTVGQLKTIRSDAVVRQGHLKKLAREQLDAQDWTIADVANTEADKSYVVGVLADQLLSSLSPDRIDDEWLINDRGISIRKNHLEMLADPFYEPAEAPA